MCHQVSPPIDVSFRLNSRGKPRLAGSLHPLLGLVAGVGLVLNAISMGTGPVTPTGFGVFLLIVLLQFHVYGSASLLNFNLTN